MHVLIVFVPLLPFLAALGIGIGPIAGYWRGEGGERIVARIALWATGLPLALTLGFICAAQGGWQLEPVQLGAWLTSGELRLDLAFTNDAFALHCAALSLLLIWIALRFAVNYLHREPGYQRCFAVLCLLAAAIAMLVLSANAVGAFVGWELAGLCSYLLIAYAYDRPAASHNATRVFICYRLGDVAFMTGIVLCLSWLGDCSWAGLNAKAPEMPQTQASVLALCFGLAAAVKSAQVPFAPWLARAMEGPTPTSAVFYGAVVVHAGVFLLLLLRPLFEQAPLALALVAVAGAATALYAWLCGLAQTDVKSSLIFAVSTQLGLMFLECGLGFWDLAAWHMAAHAVFRSYQLFTAPALMLSLRDLPSPPTPAIPGYPTVYMAAIQRCWLERFTDWAVSRPIKHMARDALHLEARIDHCIGSPASATRTLSSLAQWEEHKLGSTLDSRDDTFSGGTGIAHWLTDLAASLSQGIERRFLVHGESGRWSKQTRPVALFANAVETGFLQLRYLWLLVLVTLVAML